MSWRGMAGAAVGTIATLAVLAPATASAQYNLEPGPVPQEVIDIFADCPELPDDVFPVICLKLTASDGELKLGDTVASVDDPIEVEAAIGTRGSEGVIVPAEGSGGPSAEVNVPGGITGIPELDPILAVDPLGVLTVSASPQLGEPTVGRPGQDPTAAGPLFLIYAKGAATDDPDGQAIGALSLEEFLELNGGGIGLGLPLSIKLNNTLFGENCQIGTPDDPFTINLTNGITEPPEGIEPLTGEFGEGFATLYNGEDSVFDDAHAGVNGARFVDNTFAVPGAKGCDLLPADVKGGVDQLEDLLGIDTGVGTGEGLFDPVINDQVGLPADAGVNRAEFSIDIETLAYETRHPAE